MRPGAGNIVSFSLGYSIPGSEWWNLLSCGSTCPKVVMRGLRMLKVPANPAIHACPLTASWHARGHAWHKSRQ